jgi:hypothetical protein
MAYQPNPFVNPQQRGFELPACCKDLNDVLARVGQGPFTMPPRVEGGGVSELRSYVGQLYEAKSPRLVLVVMNSERGALLILAYSEIRFELTLLLHRESAFLEETLVELFGVEALITGSEENEELRTVHIPLPDFWDDAAQAVIDLLIRGYGLTENARLLFHYQEKKEGETRP